MFALRKCFRNALIYAVAGNGIAFAGHIAFAESTPLLPHPSDGRPVYSQDRFNLSDDEEPEPLIYNQDKFSPMEVTADPTAPPVDGLRATPNKGRELSEVEIAKGILNLNEKKLEVAEQHFRKALEHDPRNFIAYEYIASIRERQANLKDAIVQLAKAKHIAPIGRTGVLNFQMGRLYLLVKNYGRAEIYLKLAVKQSAHIAASNYLLGYLMYVHNRYFEAHAFFHEARQRVIRRGARDVERDLLQPINYYLGEVYARLGFNRYAITRLRETEVGDSWEVRSAAWRVHSELNKTQYSFTVGGFFQYDTNVLLLPIEGAILPLEYASQASPKTVFTASGSVNTSPAKKWVFGADASAYLNTHFMAGLGEFDVFQLSGSPYVNWWNLKDWSMLLRYELSNALVDRTAFTRFQTTHGPLASITYTPFQKWNYELGGQFRMNSYANDLPTGPDLRSGDTVMGFLGVSLRSPNPRFRPSFRYQFEQDNAQGLNFQSRAHMLWLEGDWRLFYKTHFIFAGSYAKVGYPFSLQGRSDALTQMRITVRHNLNAHWNLIGDISQLSNASTLANFRYRRLVMSMGATYSF